MLGSSRRRGVAPLDRRAHQHAGGVRVAFASCLHRSHLLRQFFVTDRIANPPRIVTLAEMVEPSLVVDALSQIQEGGEILSAQLQLVRGTPEETLVRAQRPLRIFADMAPVLGA